MAILLSLSMMTLVNQVCSWELVTYNNVRNCEATDDTIYRIWNGDSGSLDVCQGIAGAPTNPTIKCAEYTQGGVQGPTACSDRGEDNFQAQSVHIDDTTSFGGTTADNVFCTFYASAGCDNTDQSPQEACLAPYGEGAVSFKCTQTNTQGA